MQAENYFDVWSDRNRSTLRFVVPIGATIPSIFASSTMERFSTMRVANDIAREVEATGHCSFDSDLPLHETDTLISGKTDR